jgi:hypothetical protein
MRRKARARALALGELVRVGMGLGGAGRAYHHRAGNTQVIKAVPGSKGSEASRAILLDYRGPILETSVRAVLCPEKFCGDRAQTCWSWA